MDEQCELVRAKKAFNNYKFSPNKKSDLLNSTRGFDVNKRSVTMHFL